MGFQCDRLYIAHVKRLPDLKSRRCRYRTVVPTRIGIPAAKYLTFLTFHFCSGKDVIDLFCQIYIGGLRSDSDKYDVEEAFAQYGKVISTAFSTLMSWRCWCFFFGDGTVFLVQGTRKSMGHICKFHDNWPSRKEASREAGPPLVFISVTITPILNLASPNHICNLSFTNSSFFRPSTPLFFNP